MNLKNLSLLLCMGLISCATVFAQANKYKQAKRQNFARDNYIQTEQNQSYNSGLGYSSSGKPGAGFANDSTIIIESNALMNIRPEGYIAVFSLTQRADGLEKANQLIEDRISSFKSGLKRQGLQESDFYVDFISQIPTFEYEIEKKIFSKKGIETPSGFQLKKNLHIRFKDIRFVDKMLLEASKSEIYDLVKIDLIIDNVTAIYDSLRANCVEQIQSKKKTYEALGMTFNTFFDIVSEQIISIDPGEHYQSYTAFATAITPSDVRKIDRAEKTSTLYYDRIGYEDFDVYLNPNILEPVQQFMMNLRVRYTLKRN